MVAVPTPSTVIRLYRLVLRYAGSAVLYSRPATANLRALYRSEFDIWKQRVKEGTPAVNADRNEWEEFAKRVQNTLELFHRSSTTIDIPHKLTANMANMQYHMDPKDSVLVRKGKGAQSSLSLQQSRPEFLQGKKARNSAEVERLFAWDAFAELVGMAEGSAGLLLGKVRPRRKTDAEFP